MESLTLPLIAATVMVSLLTVELFARLPFVRLGQQMNRIVHKVLRLLRSTSISDHWKEKVMLRYAGQLALLTLQLTFCLLMVGVGIVLSAQALDAVLEPAPATLHYLSTLGGMSLATLSATLYLFARMRLVTT